jgi:hypothetical protein
MQPMTYALLTPLIAVIATYIAWQQWKGNQLKLKMEGYAKHSVTLAEGLEFDETGC